MTPKGEIEEVTRYEANKKGKKAPSPNGEAQKEAGKMTPRNLQTVLDSRDYWRTRLNKDKEGLFDWGNVRTGARGSINGHRTPEDHSDEENRGT